MKQSILLIIALWAFGCGTGGQGGETSKEILMDPTGAALNEQAPDEFAVRLETSVGSVEIGRASCRDRV